MNQHHTTKIFIFYFLLAGLTISLWAADAWETKKYTEWTAKEALQVLERSPWANGELAMAAVSSQMGPSAGNSAIPYTVAWYSATPVRLAHARLASLNNRAKDEQIQQFLQPVGDFCYITVRGETRQTLMRAKKEDVLKRTYLQVRGKEKVFATDFTPPNNKTGFAIFQFRRTVNNAPLFTENDTDVEFSTEVARITLRSHFTPKKMVFENKLTF
jgi:hypothetical protein